mgnify:CR=1 FL=1
MSDTPKSQWVIEENYFTVKPVDNFRLRYFEWLNDYDPEAKHTEATDDFLDYMTRSEFVQVYEYPHKSPIKDYFEMNDNNHVIPRHLFELV